MTPEAYIESNVCGCIVPAPNFARMDCEDGYDDEDSAKLDRAIASEAKRLRLALGYFRGDKLHLMDGARETWFRGAAIWQCNGEFDDYAQSLAREFLAAR
jgi:hypothetical protein